MPILDGQGVLYSFETTPDVRLGIAIGSGSQSVSQTELPILSSWLVCLLWHFWCFLVTDLHCMIVFYFMHARYLVSFVC